MAVAVLTMLSLSLEFSKHPTYYVVLWGFLLSYFMAPPEGVRCVFSENFILS